MNDFRPTKLDYALGSVIDQVERQLSFSLTEKLKIALFDLLFDFSEPINDQINVDLSGAE